MKKRIMMVLCCLLLLLPGCSMAAKEQLQVDTVVKIPMNPETEPAETAAQAQTDAPTEPEPTEKKTASTKATSTKTSTTKSSSSSGKKTTSSSSKNSSSSSKKDKDSAVKETKPQETIPPETETETAPSATAATQPPETVPPETEDPTAAIYDISDYAMGSLAYAFLDEINACRAEAELEALTLDGRLSAIASVRAYEASVYWSSSRPDGRGGASVMGDYGYGYGSTAEHLCYGGDAAAMVAAWMGSDTHKANVLSSSFTKLGVGEYNSGGTVCVAVVFVD